MASISRRSFLARSAGVGTAVGLAGLGVRSAWGGDRLVAGTPIADAFGWRVGFSAYTFRTSTLFESLDKVAAVGLPCVELFSWQSLSPKNPDAKPGPDLSPALRKDLKNKASDLGIRLLGCYTNLDDPESSRAFFEFAAEMGFEFLVSEPPQAQLDAVERLTEEFKIDLALHNHPQPSQYWNPEIGLKALEGRSPRMGFCCDTGHWCRSGLDPVEMLEKVAPRVKTFHLKDLDKFGDPAAGDVVWGTGVGQIARILNAVRVLQIAHPYFGIEWERDPAEPLATHAASVAFLEKTARELKYPK